MNKLKLLITFSFVLSVVIVDAQKKYPYIETYAQTYQLIKSQIDDYPITLYLEYYRPDDDNYSVYTVKGWYYYDKYRIKIPLYGLSWYGRVTVYNLTDTTDIENVLNLTRKKDNIWDNYTYYENYPYFNEKICFGDKAEHDYWQNKDKKLDLFTGYESIRIYRKFSRIQVSKDSVLELTPLGLLGDYYEVKYHSSDLRKYILSFSRPSNSNIQGRCGAATEDGLIYLEFDKQGKVVFLDEYLTDSCLDHIVSTITSKTSTKVVYKVIDTSDSTSYQLSINPQTADLTVKK